MQADEIRGTLRNAGFTNAQVEGLTAVLTDLAGKDDIRELRGELDSGIRDLRGELHSEIRDLRVELHQEIGGMWRKLALMLFAQTLTIVLSMAAIQIALG